MCDLVQDLWSLLNGSMACDDEDIKRDPFDPSDRALYKVRGDREEREGGRGEGEREILCTCVI